MSTLFSSLAVFVLVVVIPALVGAALERWHFHQVTRRRSIKAPRPRPPRRPRSWNDPVRLVFSSGVALFAFPVLAAAPPYLLATHFGGATTLVLFPLIILGKYLVGMFVLGALLMTGALAIAGFQYLADALLPRISHQAVSDSM